MKKKLLTFAFLFLFVINLFALTACSDEEKPENPNNPGDTNVHIHNMTYHAAVAESCTTDGNIEYWSCSGCSKNFSDANGTNAINDIIIVKTGVHNYGNDNKCTVCGARKPTEGLAYILINNGSAYAVAGIGRAIDKEIVIPDMYENLPVTSIGEYAFALCKSLTSITIPDSVTSIGDDAFRNCTSLTSITIPDSVTSIGNAAFRNCTSLESITIGDSVTSIGSSAFYNCTRLTSITIGESVTNIGDDAFRNCTSLTSITVDENNPSYKSIDGNLYSKDGKTLIQYAIGKTDPSFVIPDSVTSIGTDAFYNCTSLTSITVDENNPSYKSIDGNLYSKDGKTLIQYAIGKTDTSFIIPDSVTSIGDSAFKDCTSLASVTIGDSVTSIGSGAFRGCSNLQSITLPFVGATKDGTSNTRFGYIFGAYSYSDNSNSVPTSLTTVVITGGTSIGAEAFSSCKSLTSVTIGDGVTSIGDDAFWGCESLTNITIGDSVTSIGDDAFWSCRSLESITIGDSVTSIGNHAFAYCTSLTSITIPDSVTSIGDDAFWSCRSLTNITIGDSVTSIGSVAFWGCTSLTSITVDENNQEFKSIDGNLYSKDGKTLIQYAISKTDTSFVIPDSVTSIGSVAFEYCTSLTSITIGDSVTSIGYAAFEDCTSLTSITIGDSVTSIGDSVFKGCTSLESITIPDSVTSIGKWAFEDCTSLTSVTIGDSVTSIGHEAFKDCTSLASVTIGDSVTSGCTSLTSITIPDSVTSIGNSAFEYCTSLNAVYITDIAKWCAIDFGNYAANPLYYANNLYLNGELVTDLVIPDSVTSIGEYAFEGCTSLESITIPDSVTSIDNGAFYGCTSLTDVYFSGTEYEWRAIAIASRNEPLENATIHYNYVPEN